MLVKQYFLFQTQHNLQGEKNPVSAFPTCIEITPGISSGTTWVSPAVWALQDWNTSALLLPWLLWAQQCMEASLKLNLFQAQVTLMDQCALRHQQIILRTWERSWAILRHQSLTVASKLANHQHHKDSRWRKVMASPLRPKNVPGKTQVKVTWWWKADLVHRHPDEKSACGLCLQEGKGRVAALPLPQGGNYTSLRSSKSRSKGRKLGKERRMEKWE